MTMNDTVRAYDKESPADQRQNGLVREAAKATIARLLEAGRPITTKAIYTAMKQDHPHLCDDSVRKPDAPNKPKWEHTVDNTLQTLKKQGGVVWTGHGWVQGKGSRLPRARATSREYRAPSSGAVAPAPSAVPTTSSTEPPVAAAGDLRTALRDRLLKTKPSEFEKVVGDLLKAMGLGQVRILGQTADGGIDGDALVPVLNVKVGFQAKRWSGNNISGALVRELVGSITTKKYDRGVLVTTSAFTAGAREEAEAADSKVILIDGEKLVDMMLEKGLGIRTVTTVTQQELDEAFFKLS